MKTFRKFGMLLLAGVLGVVFSSCNKENELTPDQQEPEYITVNLGLAGEYVQFSESPLTRAAADTSDLYGIKVYTLSKDSYNGDSYQETMYAYGVFNSLQNVTIKLLAGQIYKFQAVIVVDGNVCTNHSDGWCRLEEWSSWNVGTSFRYTSNSFHFDNFDYIGTYHTGHAYLTSNHDRYYGELAEYNPENGGTVEIQTKRVSYGAHYIVEGLNEGTLDVEVRSTEGSSNLYTVTIPSINPDLDEVFSFHDLCLAWQGRWDSENQCYRDYYRDKLITLSWNKEDGSRTPLGTYAVTFKRNVKTTIRIKVEDTTTPNGIIVTRQETAWNYDDTEYHISGGDVVEVPVTEE